MFRLIFFLTVAACGIHNISTSPATPPTSRELIFSDPEESKYDTTMPTETIHTKELEELSSVVYAFKNQFRDIIEEVILQVFNYVKSIFQNIKLKLLKKLGRYTLSDVFHATFDGVADFVVESSTDDSLFDILDVEPAKPSYGYSNPYYFGAIRR